MTQALSALLAQIGASACFAAVRSAAPGNLNLEVEGVGRVRLPVTAATARKLCAVARPARHGFKDQTRLDTEVRNTWEISRRRISIDASRWTRTLLPQLEQIRRDLGMPGGTRLEARLHNLLVYEPGHFFVAHQDSEKSDGMVGSLVVGLPSSFTGGELVIEHHGGRWNDDDDDDDEDEDGEADESGDSFRNLNLTDLIDSDIELRHWIGPDGRAQKIAAAVETSELCYTKPSVDFEPFESEHEGYMGNWGNTVEHWYHRAAVVLWPRERTFVIRAKASAPWAIGELTKVLKAGNTAQALAWAQRLLPFWGQGAVRHEKPVLFDRTLKVAAALGDPALAAALLQPFALTRTTAGAGPRFVELLRRYGLKWCQALLRKWASENKDGPQGARLDWLASSLRGFCEALCEKGGADGRALAQSILSEQWGRLREESRRIREHGLPRELARELTKLGRPLLAAIECSLIAEQPNLHREIVQFVVADVAEGPAGVWVGILRAAHENFRGRELRGLGLLPLHECCSLDLATRLSAGARAPNDWSIATPLHCRCKLCAVLSVFLRARDKTRFDWPLAKAERSHIHGIADSHDLPVTHITQRSGSPFTLVLKKTDDVFNREAAERAVWQRELQWLNKTVKSF